MNIYNDIAKRTGGEIYIGVVGPVRTGKSTFIKRFTEEFILPKIADNYDKERITDELPQSGQGRVIMTNQPKFVPDKSVEIVLDDNISVKARLIDCVGYLIGGANGHTEDGRPRMVRTPWFDHDIPFEEAADIGTHKVIESHSTIGIVVTSDGTITDIPRENYISAEERTVNELKQIGKPFAVIINSREPRSAETTTLRDELAAKYNVPVHAIDVMNINQQTISEVMSSILQEFPVKDIKIKMPDWVYSLDFSHWLIKEIVQFITVISDKSSKIKDVQTVDAVSLLNDSEKEIITDFYLSNINLGTGMAEFTLTASDNVFYQVLSERCGCTVTNDYELFDLMKDFVRIKSDYERIEPALRSARETGYGMVSPTVDDIELAEPELVKHSGKFGVKLNAKAPSLHFLRADIETTVSPIVGSEQQSNEFYQRLVEQFESESGSIWQTDIFGKPLQEVVKEGLAGKLSDMPEDVRFKMQETLQRIINEGTEGVMCIIL